MNYVRWLSFIGAMWLVLLGITIGKPSLPNVVWFAILGVALTLVFMWRVRIENMLLDHWSVGLDHSVLDDLGPHAYWHLGHAVGFIVLFASAIAIGQTGLKIPTGVLLLVLVPLMISRQVWGIYLMWRMDRR